MTSAPLNKQTEMLRLLDEGQVMVHLDPRREGVQVPGYLAEDPVLRLNIAYGFNLPTLEVDDEGVYAVLSFGGRDFGCWLPWPAVFALTLPDRDHQGSLWPEDMPDEIDPMFAAIRHLQPADEAEVDGDRVVSIRKPVARGLSVIDGGAQPSEIAPDVMQTDDTDDTDDTGDSDDIDGPSDESPPSGGSHLRLVKG